MDWTGTLLEWRLPIGATLTVTAATFWLLRRAIPDEPATRVIRQLVETQLARNGAGANGRSAICRT